MLHDTSLHWAATNNPSGTTHMQMKLPQANLDLHLFYGVRGQNLEGDNALKAQAYAHTVYFLIQIAVSTFQPGMAKMLFDWRYRAEFVLGVASTLLDDAQLASDFVCPTSTYATPYIASAVTGLCTSQETIIMLGPSYIYPLFLDFRTVRLAVASTIQISFQRIVACKLPRQHLCVAINLT